MTEHEHDDDDNGNETNCVCMCEQLRVMSLNNKNIINKMPMLVAQTVKHLPATQQTWVRSLS